MRQYKYSAAGLALTERFEGERFAAYLDDAGVWTIGFGHIKGVKEGMRSTHQQNVEWLQQDVAEAVNGVNKVLNVDLAQNQFDALVDFTFNLGVGAFQRSTMLKYLNAGKFEAAAQEFEKWSHAGGKVVAGLLRRRLAEKAEFEGNGNGETPQSK